MIDWKRVLDLKAEVGADDFGEVVEIFLEEVEEVVMRLRSIQDRSKLGEDLHFLKGSSLNLGFANFSSLCEEGEKAITAGQVASIDLEAILASYVKSRTIFLESPNII